MSPFQSGQVWGKCWPPRQVQELASRIQRQRARRRSSRTRPVPCQQDCGGTRLDRLQERGDDSTEARPRRHTCRQRTARLWSRRQQRSPETAPCALPTWLRTEWTRRNQWSASADTCKHHERDTWWRSNSWPVICRSIVSVLWCSTDSRRKVQISKCMWIQIGLET